VIAVAGWLTAAALTLNASVPAGAADPLYWLFLDKAAAASDRRPNRRPNRAARRGNPA
jgi:hypothetical protein